MPPIGSGNGNGVELVAIPLGNESNETTAALKAASGARANVSTVIAADVNGPIPDGCGKPAGKGNDWNAVAGTVTFPKAISHLFFS
jgi:hypothetical protein